MDNEFNKWVDIWDKISSEMDAPKPLQQNISYFGMSGVDDDTLETINKSDARHWRDVIDRTDDMPINSPTREEELITEAKKAKKPKSSKKTKKSKPEKKKSPDVDDPKPYEEDGVGAILAKALGDDKQFVAPNPIHFSSVGMDQKPRITPNWTSGEKLYALAKLKSSIYDLESEMLSVEGMGGDSSELKNKLEKMIKQCEDLSQALIPDITKDVS